MGHNNSWAELPREQILLENLCVLLTLLRVTDSVTASMSWLRDAFQGPPPTALMATDGSNDVDGYPRVKDPFIPDRMVSTKPANRPFLA
jgi:hypothetical protein